MPLETNPGSVSSPERGEGPLHEVHRQLEAEHIVVRSSVPVDINDKFS